MAEEYNNHDPIAVERRFLDELVRQHDKVHTAEKERSTLLDEGHWRQHASEHKAVEAWESAHLQKHEAESRAVEVAIAAEQRRLEAHREAHEAAHASHEALHEAYDAAHIQQHDAEQRALEAAVASMEARLQSMNQFREQLRDQTATFVRDDAFQAFKDERRMALQQIDQALDRRYDELRALIATEREERREMMGTRKGALDYRTSVYTAIGITGTILGILIVTMNLIAVTPAVVVN